MRVGFSSVTTLSTIDCLLIDVSVGGRGQANKDTSCLASSLNGAARVHLNRRNHPENMLTFAERANGTHCYNDISFKSGPPPNGRVQGTP